MPPLGGSPDSGLGGPRRTRLACDGCRARRIKCNYQLDGACRACLAAKIPCTQDRPRKKRGPVNRYVEAQRRKQTEQQDRSQALVEALQLHPDPSTSVSESPVASETVIHSLERLAPIETIEQALHDWFEFVHPVAPILHRDSFLREFDDVENTKSLDFVNLVFSVCAASVSTLRRRSMGYGTLIPVERCYELSTHNEPGPWQTGHSYNLTLRQCQTKYNFAVSLAAVRGIDNPTSYMLLAQAATATSHLLYFRAESLSFSEKELLKRLYWLCFANQCTQGLRGRPGLVCLSANIDNDALKPLEITDAELSTITPGQELWHGNVTSYIPGLNALSNLFILWFRSQQGYHVNKLPHLYQHMELVLTSLDNVPPELRWRGGLSRPLRGNFGTDVQMVNLCITQFHIRSFLLEQMDRVATSASDFNTRDWVQKAKQTLVDDMLIIVCQMPEDTLEANGYSLIPKLRDIGLALLNDNTGDADRAFTNLDRLLAKLERLDVHPATGISPESHQ